MRRARRCGRTLSSAVVCERRPVVLRPARIVCVCFAFFDAYILILVQMLGSAHRMCGLRALAADSFLLATAPPPLNRVPASLGRVAVTEVLLGRVQLPPLPPGPVAETSGAGGSDTHAAPSVSSSAAMEERLARVEAATAETSTRVQRMEGLLAQIAAALNVKP